MGLIRNPGFEIIIDKERERKGVEEKPAVDDNRDDADSRQKDEDSRDDPAH